MCANSGLRTFGYSTSSITKHDISDSH